MASGDASGSTKISDVDKMIKELGLREENLLKSLRGAMGDFNEVLDANEHDGVDSRSQAQMDVFKDALDTRGLADIGYKGNPWTFEKKVADWTDV
ncbi:Potassium channel AKT1 [Hordeum vulgare]|nr:Potassium channel AKT1 [Hordeum vulgare]